MPLSSTCPYSKPQLSQHKYYEAYIARPIAKNRPRQESVMPRKCKQEILKRICNLDPKDLTTDFFPKKQHTKEEPDFIDRVGLSNRACTIMLSVS